MWSFCRYNVLIMTQMLFLEIMHGIGFTLMYYGQKMVTMTVF